MPIPWAIIVSLLVVGLAYGIKHFAAEVIEEEKVFLGIIGAFLIIYIGAAMAVGTLNPSTIVNQGYLAVSE